MTPTEPRQRDSPGPCYASSKPSDVLCPNREILDRSAKLGMVVYCVEDEIVIPWYLEPSNHGIRYVGHGIRKNQGSLLVDWLESFELIA